MGLFLFGLLLVGLLSAGGSKRKGKLEGARLLRRDEAPPEFRPGQWVCQLEHRRGGIVQQCLKDGEGWRYDVEFDDGSRDEMSGEEIVP